MADEPNGLTGYGLARLTPESPLFRGARRWFDGVLGPGCNRAHADYPHVEHGSWRVCR